MFSTYAKARFTAIVDFPTPPLQLDTAMILLTLAKDESSRAAALRGAETVKEILARETHGKAWIVRVAASIHYYYHIGKCRTREYTHMFIIYIMHLATTTTIMMMIMRMIMMMMDSLS